MTHPRTSIRQAVVALLAASGTDAGSQITDSAVKPPEAFPAINVFTPQDDFEEWSDMQPRHFDRKLRVAVECWVQGTSGTAAIAAAVDDLTEQVEDAIEGDPLLASQSVDATIFEHVRYDSTLTEFTDEVDPPGVKATVIYQYTYRFTG